MAVQDPPQPQTQQPPTHPQVQRLIDAANAGLAVQAAGAATVAPGVAAALPAVAAAGIVSVPAEIAAQAVKTAIVLRVLRKLMTQRRTKNVSALEAALRKQFPGLDDTVIRRIVEQEIRYEDAFARKSDRRVQADLQKVGQLDKDAQRKRLAEIIDREKHYGTLREKAMWARAMGHAHNETVKQTSPLGATWVLGAAKNHTAGCLALAGRSWPWSVLDTIPPPLHTGCQCSLKPLGPNDTVPPAGEAMAMARRAMALEEAVREVADPGEIDAYLAGEEIRPSIERALERVGGEVLHQGEWMTLAEAQAPPTGTMVALFPTPNVASKLAVKGGEPKDEIHLTLAFLGKADKLPDPDGLKQTVADWAARTPPLDGEISGHGLFTAGPEPVTYVSPDLPGLPEARADLADALEQGDHPLSKDHGFTPHMTIAYSDRTKDLPDHGGRRIGFGKASLVIGPERHDFKLAGKLQEATYEEGLHPRGRGGKWITKLGSKRLELKGEKKLTTPQVHAAVRKVAQGVTDFYGGDKLAVQAHHEPDYMASVAGVARFRHPGELMAGINYGQRVMDTVRDPDYGVHDLRIVAHEAAHSLSGTRPGPLPGFSQTFEEGGAEILSLWFWHHRAQPFDERDATRLSGKWTKGDDSLAHSVVYRPYVEELMRRAASKVGWDRTAIVDEVERVMRGDHTARLHFRDATNPEFPLPKDLPDTEKAIGREDDSDHAVALIKWLVSPEPKTEPTLGGDWKGNEAAKADAQRAIKAVTDRYDAPIKHVNIDQGATDDVGRLAGKSNDTIYLSPRVADDAFMANRHKDWRTVSVNVPDDSVGRVRTVTHEYAHILDGELQRRHPDAYKKLNAFLNEQGSYGMPGTRTRLQAGLEAPSAYGTENRYEFVAEALTDWIHNGEKAHPSSQFIGKLFDEYLGHKAELTESFFDTVLHPRGRGGKWVDAIQHAETEHAEPTAHEGFTGEDFASKLDGFSHGGITAVRSNRTQTQHLFGEVWLNLQKPGDAAPVGLARVTLKPPDHRGVRTAELSNIYLHEAEQNQGFGRAFTDHLFQTLRDGGVDRSAVEAVSIGGYTWARRGYVWTGDKGAVQRGILDEAKRDGRWDRIKDWPGADELERKLLAGEFTSEAELAAYGRARWTESPDRERTWLGKELMIGSHWKGDRPVTVT